MPEQVKIHFFKSEIDILVEGLELLLDTDLDKGSLDAVNDLQIKMVNYQGYLGGK